jgi:pyruvate/2-oxoglutarate dehydrogenase complex dihydrolipoamide dehydrogenase (E3) component
VSAVASAALGASVALIEKRFLGGDCLNMGCVPSKALLRSARAVADVRDAAQYGVRVPEHWTADFPFIMDRMRRLRAHISTQDAVKTLQQKAVHVFLGDACFVGRDAVRVDVTIIRFSRAVIATGARAAAPEIPGLAATGYLTNETVFNLTELPRRLAVIGGGPLGCELAQAFARFGADVTQIERGARIMGREDPDAADVVRLALKKDGVRILLKTRIKSVERRGSDKVLAIEHDDREEDVIVDEILVGVGRTPNVEGLALETAGVRFDLKRGVEVNDRLQSTNGRIYAAGDVCSRFKFTHMSEAQAAIAIQNALFPLRKKASALIVPWCTFTDPEVAHVGLSESQALDEGVPVETFLQSFKDVDRAILDGEESGFVKFHVRKGSDTILGATIVARHAGEMISEITVAMKAGAGLRTIASAIHPYPTQAESIKKAAIAYDRSRLTPGIKSIIRAWLKAAR